MVTPPKKAALSVVLVTWSLLACGQDRQQDTTLPPGAGGANSGPLAACQRFCDNEHEALCGLYASAGDCYRYECSLPRDAPDACVEAFEAFYDCTAPAIEICNDEACQMESQALFEACN